MMLINVFIVNLVSTCVSLSTYMWMIANFKIDLKVFNETRRFFGSNFKFLQRILCSRNF